jgi:hypothetical protein
MLYVSPRWARAPSVTGIDGYEDAAARDLTSDLRMRSTLRANDAAGGGMHWSRRQPRLLTKEPYSRVQTIPSVSTDDQCCCPFWPAKAQVLDRAQF